MGYDKVVDRQYVRAEVDGTVSTLKVAKGDEVTSGQEVAIIQIGRASCRERV